MLKTIQASTGLIFALFVAVHLLNTWLGALGPGIYDGVQATARAVYQFAPVEALLLTALLLHIASGLLRIWREPKRTLSTRGRLHRYSGLFLALVIGGHIAAVRGASWWFDVYPEFLGLAFTVEAVPLYFYPYYFLLGVAGCYHALNGTGIALGRLGKPWHLTSTRLRQLSFASMALTLMFLMALGGVWTHLDDPAHSAFAQLAMELLGESAP